MQPSVELPRLMPRAPNAHKGDFGRALLIGGSRSMSGAIALAGMAALHGGAGLVRLAVPDVCQAIVAGHNPSYMTLALPSDRQGRISRQALPELIAACEHATVVALGPGLGRSLGLNVLVERLYQSVPMPMVVDADALNALAERGVDLARHAGPRVLTPHPGEFRGLVDVARAADRAAMEAEAERLATEADVVCVLKGHATLVTDGARSYRNTTGNPGMATGGTGDVLTGIVTALLCQRLPSFDAAQLGVYLHGYAGDIAAKRLGEPSLTAVDLVNCLPEAIGRLG